MNSISYFLKLGEHGVKGELHIFPEGYHGWGFSSLREEWNDFLPAAARKEFSNCLEIWLESLR